MKNKIVVNCKSYEMDDTALQVLQSNPSLIEQYGEESVRQAFIQRGLCQYLPFPRAFYNLTIDLSVSKPLNSQASDAFWAAIKGSSLEDVIDAYRVPHGYLSLKHAIGEFAGVAFQDLVAGAVQDYRPLQIWNRLKFSFFSIPVFVVAPEVVSMLWDADLPEAFLQNYAPTLPEAIFLLPETPLLVDEDGDSYRSLFFSQIYPREVTYTILSDDNVSYFSHEKDFERSTLGFVSPTKDLQMRHALLPVHRMLKSIQEDAPGFQSKWLALALHLMLMTENPDDYISEVQSGECKKKSQKVLQRSGAKDFYYPKWLKLQRTIRPSSARGKLQHTRSSPRPHWREPHQRTIRFGKGRQYSKVVDIPLVLVNERLLSPDELTDWVLKD